MRPALRNVIMADALPTPALSFNFLLSSILPTFGVQALTFTRATTATYFDVTGTRQTAASGTPRFNFDRTTHAPLGLLIEGQRVNSFLNSGAPATQTITVAPGTYTLWMEGTGSITAANGTATATYVPSGGAAVDGTPVTVTVTVGGTVTTTVSGSPTLAQFENGGGASSYIPTAGSTVQRNSDVLSGVVNGDWYNPAECSIVAEASGNAVAFNNSPLLELSDGSTNNRITLIQGTAGVFDNSIKSGGTNYGASSAGSGWTNGVVSRASLGVKTGGADLAYALPAPGISSSTSVVMPLGVNKIQIGSGGSGILFGHVRKIDVYGRRLTKSQLLPLLAFK